ncbi:MAG: MBL fold metallo-hydrolase [Bacillota bacterium]|nr:MBL fold metallo-hydrolase [Bacillota bacterium]
MELQSIRHATCLISYNGKKILLDPMLSPAGTLDPVPDVPNPNKNPLVEIPISMDEILKVDAVLLTHTHRDHFDNAALELLPKSLPVLCQPQDFESLSDKGFVNIYPIDKGLIFMGITFIRTDGNHGSGILAIKMAPVSGFVLKCKNEPTLYLTGDTIWCAKVERALKIHTPDIILCFAGEARFSAGGHITLSKSDIEKIARASGASKLVVVHMEAWNHCRLTRSELRKYLKDNKLDERVLVPENGEKIKF